MRHALQALALLALLAGSGHAYIDAMNATLEQFSGGFAVITEGVIEKVDLEKKVAVLKFGRALKRKAELTHARLDIGAGGRGYPDAVLKHLVPGAPVWFDALIATTAQLRSTVSFLLKWARTSSYTSSGTCVSAILVTASVQLSAALSRSV